MLQKKFTNFFFNIPWIDVCLIDIAETLTDSLACSQSIKIASVQDRVTTVYTYSLHIYMFLIFVVENILCVLFS